MKIHGETTVLSRINNCKGFRAYIAIITLVKSLKSITSAKLLISRCATSLF